MSSDFYDYMPLDEYLALMEKRGPKTAVSAGHKRGRKGSSRKSFPPPLTPPVTVCKTIPMPAFGKARPRVTENGTYMPKAYQQQVKQLRAAFGSVPAGLVHVSVTAVRQVPASWSKKKQAAAIGRYAKPKPDADNILGAVMDALFEDDDRVISVFCEKVWGAEHALVIEVAPANQEA
jgi:Holliday junction resolvase RusA-like endonuclease